MRPSTRGQAHRHLLFTLVVGGCCSVAPASWAAGAPDDAVAAERSPEDSSEEPSSQSPEDGAPPEAAPPTDEPLDIPLPGDPVEARPEAATVPSPVEDRPESAPAAASAGGFAGERSQPELGGYVEDTLNLEYRRAAKELFPLNVLRTRLTLGGRPHPMLDFSLSAVGIIYSGASQIPAAPYLPSELEARLIPAAAAAGLPGTADLLSFKLEDRLYLHEAFVTLRTDWLVVRAGRHKYYSGTGFAYNPIDLLNRKNPLDPTYELDGLDGILLKVDLPLQSELQGFIRFAERFATTDYVARLKTVAAGWDLCLQYTFATRPRVDWDAINTPEGVAALAAGAPMATFTRRFPWHLVGGALAGELFGVGIHAEGGYAFVKDPVGGDAGMLADAGKDHERILLGLDYTFVFQLYVLLEYMRLGQGRTGTPQITLSDRMAALTGEILAVDRDTAFIGTSYPLADLTELAVYAIVGCNDPSAIINPWLLLDLYPGLKLSLSAFVPVGSESGQNGRLGYGGFARVRLSH